MKKPIPSIQQLVADIGVLIAHANERAPGNTLVPEVQRVNPEALLWLTRLVFLESAHIELCRPMTPEEQRLDAAAERVFDALHTIRRWEAQVRAQMVA